MHGSFAPVSDIRELLNKKKTLYFSLVIWRVYKLWKKQKLVTWLESVNREKGGHIATEPFISVSVH
jgi:hypothetical protein